MGLCSCNTEYAKNLSKQVAFAQSEINAVSNSKDYSIKWVADEALCDQCYEISINEKNVSISGGASIGLMYGGLEFADMLQLNEIESTSGSPYIKNRGLKFNIPLDARTPSYDDTGDAAQKNIATVWEFDFWKNFLDNMARNRYNLLTLWSNHPYPSMVKVPEYPDVALNDVCIYNGDITTKTHMKWKGEDIQNPKKLNVVKKMSIKEKMDFWKKVFQYAEDRGVDIYLFHWNVFVFGAEGKHGIEWKQDSPITVDYFRKSVKAFMLQYPMIKGIGVTAGEHINRKLINEYRTENWMWLTYGQGIMDAKKENPNIDVRFIFRRHWSDLADIRDSFKDYEGSLDTSFKYSRARMYSSTNPPWFDKIYKSIVEDTNIDCWLNMRNDDVFTLRWGDPNYAKAYIKNIPVNFSPGFYMGPDGYVWGKEFISKDPEIAGQFEIDKHWYRFKIWGQTAYNPNLDDKYWANQIKIKFPEVDANLMQKTWSASSDVFAWVDKIHFRQNDAQFAPEGCIGWQANGGQLFHSVNSFLNVGAMPEQGLQSIADYVKSQDVKAGLTPFQVADNLRIAAKILLDGAYKLDEDSTDGEFQETLENFKAMAYLAQYYANKIEGASYVGRFRLMGNEVDKKKAVSVLNKAVNSWENYAKTIDAIYKPQLLARTDYLDVKAILTHVKKDVDIARNAKYGDEVSVKDYNFLWKKDSRKF